jgi:hypothetical protein
LLEHFETGRVGLYHLAEVPSTLRAEQVA